MSKRKSALTQAQKAAVAKLAKLHRKGFFKGNVRRPTRYGIRQTRVFANVIADKAAVVKVPRGKAKEYKDAFKVKGGKVVIPKIEGERVRYNKKTGMIESTRFQHGERIKKQIIPTTIDKATEFKLGKNQYYVLPLGQHFHIREKSMAAIAAFIYEYEMKYGRAYKNWQKYVVIETLEGERLRAPRGSRK